jgi:oxygen-independent coproporphyrinogen III oxidase
VVSRRYREPFLDALSEELYLRRNWLEGEKVRTIYLGGGTPSNLPPGQIGKILETVHNYYNIAADPEVTLEANPEDISKEILARYRDMGINRLSIGVQSFFDDDLQYLNRIHSADQARRSIILAKETGFTNLSLDLIYGIPTLDNAKWEKNLETAFSLDIPHISAYSLTVEEKTGLDVLIRKKTLPAPLEESVISHFRILLKRMKENGYLHYEISNFCRDDFFSKHNSMYWTGEPYLGAGPSAHSYNGNSRQWNVGSIVQYIDQVQRNESFYESEDLTPVQRYNERVMVSLRTMWGCDVNRIAADFGEEAAAYFRNQASQYTSEGKLLEKDGIYYLTEEGKLFADRIASDLFLEPQDSSQG